MGREWGGGVGMDGFFERQNMKLTKKIKSFTPKRTEIYESRWDPSK